MVAEQKKISFYGAVGTKDQNDDPEKKAYSTTGITKVAQDVLKAFCRENLGMSGQDVVSAIVLWFCSQVDPVQRAVIKNVSPHLANDYATMLEDLAKYLRNNGGVDLKAILSPPSEPSPRKPDIAKIFNGESDEDADRRESQTGPPVEPPPHRPKGRGH